MSQPIPINPKVLCWARVSLNLSLKDVAKRMKKKVTEIEAWERGEASPTYVQLETLAYDIYKRPIALFFFPEVPEEETIEQSFRTLPEKELQRIPSRMLYLLRKAKVLQLNLSELYENVNPGNSLILRDLDFTTSIAATKMADRVRGYLGIQLTHQQSWQNTDDAFKHWRMALEDHGVFVFKDTFNPPGKKKTEPDANSFSGFSMYDVNFPVIYVNNNNTKTRQIFTLFHELAHLLMQTGGVDTWRDDYIEHLTGDNKQTEILCNQFASEFLVPSSDFQSRSAGMPILDSTIEELADFYSVSRETILRRLLDWGQVSQQDYEKKTRQWWNERKERGGSGGDYYRNKGSYLGEKYIEAVFSHYHKGRITVEQTADFLDLKTKNVPQLEEWLFNQGTTT